jgi:hypothetical protein
MAAEGGGHCTLILDEAMEQARSTMSATLAFAAPVCKFWEYTRSIADGGGRRREER